MNDLVPIENRGGVETVNARDLHQALGSKQHFSDWVKNRIEKYGFQSGVDFTDHKVMIGKTTAIEYFVSIDMAKELSMIENTDKGREVRRWFIEREKQLARVEITGPEQFEKMMEAAMRRLLPMINPRKGSQLEFGIIPDAPNDGSHMSLRAFCRVRKYDYTDAELSRMGKELRAFCDGRGFSMGMVDDPTYSKVRTYPIAILEDYFA